MLHNSRKSLGFKKNMVYKIPLGVGGGKPYPASGLILFLPKFMINLTILILKLSISHFKW